MQHRDVVILKKFLSEIAIGENMIGDKDYAAFEADELLKRAVCMTVINIGELVKAVSDELRTKCPHVNWRAIAGMRDITAHKYQTLRMEDVYNVVRSDFPVLKMQIAEILSGE